MDLECHKKISAALIVRELGQYVDCDHPVLRSSRQCALLDLPKYTLYYQPAPILESKPRIMARIDALDLEERCSASRRMVTIEGTPISRGQEGCQFTSSNFVARLQAQEMMIGWSGR